MKRIWQYSLIVSFTMIGLASNPVWGTHPVAIQEQEAEQEQDKEEDQDDEKEDAEEQDDDRSVQERMQEAMQAAGQDRDKGVELIGKIYEDFPEDERVGLTYVQATQQLASMRSRESRPDGNDYYYKSAKVARKLMNDPDLPDLARPLIATALYNEACSLGVDEKKDEAMKVLKEAFDFGFEKYDLAREDSDFGDLLETDEFKALIDNAQKGASGRLLAKTKEKLDAFESFDFEFEIDTLDNETVSNESLSGKVIVVDLWATWSPESRQETAALVKLKEAFSDDLEIVGLAFERGDDDEAYDAVTNYIKRNKINYPCALGDEDVRDQLPEFESYPTKVFIDQEGKVRFAKVGSSTFSELELVVKELMGDK